MLVWAGGILMMLGGVSGLVLRRLRARGDRRARAVLADEEPVPA
jgi:cytochrome c biogenesis factor